MVPGFQVSSQNNSLSPCVTVSDRALHSLWVHLRGDAAEGQRPGGKAGEDVNDCMRPKIGFWKFRKKKTNPAPLNVCSFLRICAAALGAGPHWARSRLCRQRPMPPVTRRAGMQVWSVNPPSSHISTAAKVWPGTVADTFLLLHFCFWCCIKKAKYNIQHFSNRFRVAFVFFHFQVWSRVWNLGDFRRSPGAPGPQREALPLPVGSSALQLCQVEQLLDPCLPMQRLHQGPDRFMQRLSLDSKHRRPSHQF